MTTLAAFLRRLLALLAVLGMSVAMAADGTVLIQLETDGRYRVWHSTGTTALVEDELLALAANATPEGSEPLPTAAGPARAYATRQGVVVRLAGVSGERSVLIDRDDCGGVKLWHGEGTTSLTDDDLTELMLVALPGGSKRMRIGKNYAKAFTSRVGVVAVIWKPVERK